MDAHVANVVNCCPENILSFTFQSLFVHLLLEYIVYSAFLFLFISMKATSLLDDGGACIDELVADRNSVIM